jgi:TPR repeat protein
MFTGFLSGTGVSLGICYANGDGVMKDTMEAVKWYRKAADQGVARAQCNLANCYYHGQGVAKDYAETVKWLRKAAEQNYARAQYDLGYCYENGCGVMKDYAEAVKWYRKAAEQNDVDAQYNLGICYANGRGVEKDYVEAVKWWRKAAEQNDAQAQYNLGLCYANGQGVEKDEAEAVKWYRKAAEQNNALAQYNLADCYANGQGVEMDEVIARRWLEISAKNGNLDAAEVLKSLIDSRYSNLPSPNQSSSVRSVPSVAIKTPQITAINVSAKVTEVKATWWKWAWKLTLVNRSSSPVEVNTDVQFYDKDGYIVDEDSHGVHQAVLGANSSQNFTGYKLVELPGAKNVVSVGAKVEVQ